MCNTLLNRAMNYLTAGDYREAVRAFQKVLAEEQDTPEAYWGLAQAYTHLGLYEQALQHYQEYVTHKPYAAEAFLSIASVYYSMGRYHEAISHYRRALEMDPSLHQAYYGLGYVKLHALKDYQGAREDFLRAVEIQPSAAALYALGCLHYELSQYQESIAFFRQAIDLQPDHLDALQAIAGAYCAMGELQQALSYYNQALALDPSSEEIHYMLGLMKLFAVRNVQAAREHFAKSPRYIQTLLSSHSKDPCQWYQLGAALRVMGDDRKALRAYEQATQFQDGFAEAHLEVARLKKQLGSLDEAITHFQKAIEQKEEFNQDASVWCELGYAYYETRRFHEAVHAFQRAWLLDPNDPAVLYALGCTHKRLKSWEQAIECFKKAIELNPRYCKAHGGLFRIYLRMWRWRDALVIAKHALRSVKNG